MTKSKKHSILYKRFDEGSVEIEQALLAQLDRASVYGNRKERSDGIASLRASG